MFASGWKKTLITPTPCQRLRLDVLDVVDRHCHAALGVGHDAVRHVAGREAGVVPDHADDGNIDVREDIDRRAQDDQWRHRMMTSAMTTKV